MCLRWTLGDVVSASAGSCEGLWGRDALEASFLRGAFRAWWSRRPALVCVVLQPLSSRPGFGFEALSLLYLLSPQLRN